MHELMRKVKKELDTIADKGISTGNLEITNKLVDIYKDLKEICQMEEGGYKMYDANRSRGADGRYREYDGWDEYGRNGNNGGNYGHMRIDERYERQLNRMRDGMEQYAAGRNRYRDGGSHERMIEGVEMTMAAIVAFIESMIDFAETPDEKEIVRKYVDKLKKI